MVGAEIVFWVAAGIVVYTYFGYPLLLLIVSSVVQAGRDLRFLFRRATRRTKPVTEQALPRISVLIPAHNEEEAIAAKLENTFALDYPNDRLEVIVGSDGSDDRTNEIVESFAGRGVVLAAYGERRGKPSVINDTVERASGEIIILSDATTMIDPDAIRNIVRHFEDPKVGAVNGELRFVSPGEGHKGEGLYWRYEVMIKFMENRLGVVLGSSGALCAFRKKVYRPIPADCICDDFLITANVMIDGHDPEAQSVAQTAPSVELESSRRERIGAGNFQALGLTTRLLNPARGPVAWCYLSHKIFKWTTWAFMAGAFVANLPLVSERLYFVFFLLQIAFYASALLKATGTQVPVISRISSITHYFISMHLALFLGFVRYGRGSQKVAWQRKHR